MNWNQLEVIFSNMSFLSLFLGMVTYWINLIFFNLKKINFVLNLGRILTISANIFLFLTLCSRWIVFGYFPLSNLYESLLFLTWLLITIYIYGELKTKSRLFGALLIPVALFINGFANLCLPEEMQEASPLVPALQSNWLMLHVTMMLSSYALLISGSLCCILFLILSELKELNLTFIDSNNIEKSPKLFIEIMIAVIIYKRLLDSNSKINLEIYTKIKVNYLLKLAQILLLQMLENFTYRIIGLGFPSLTIGIIAGGVWANEAWGSYWSWDPKETWAFITWSIFAIYLHVRYINGWKGLKLAYIGSSGFFIIWICYLGVNFLGKGLHSYGWIGQ